MNWVEKLSVFLSGDPGASLLRSLVMVVILVVFRSFLLRALLKFYPDTKLEERRRWSVTSRNTVVFISLVGLVLIWASELQSFALSIVAFAAALVLATKELIMCVSGGILRATTQSYTLGDVIEVGSYQGRVVDINLFSTTLVELGPHGLSHRMTGKLIKMPNSFLLSFAVIRDNELGMEYILDTIIVPVPYIVDPVKAERVIIEATEKYIRPYSKEAESCIDIQELEKLLDTPSIEPRITIVPVDDKQYKFVIRAAMPKGQRNRIEQEIYRDFLFACYGQSEPEASL